MNSNGKTDKNLLLIVIAIIALVFVTNCLLSLYCYDDVYDALVMYIVSGIFLISPFS